MRAISLVAAAVLGVACAFLVACGDRNGLIPSSSAQRLKSDLSAVSNAVQARNCEAAKSAADRVRADVVNLPSSVDQALVNRLSHGAGNLRRRALVQCQQATQSQPQETAPQTQSTPSQTTTTPTNTTPTTTTPTTTPTTTTPTGTTTTPAPTGTTPSGGGGTGGMSAGGGAGGTRGTGDTGGTG